MEYFKIFSLLKAKSEEELIVEEAQNLEFVRAEGFHEFISVEKKWELLDSRIAKEFPQFIPPTSKSAEKERVAVLEKRCEELAA